jgi:hypothetical protein
MLNPEKKAGRAFLSIDFEDSSYDFKRALNLPYDSGLRIDSLWDAYESIERFCHSDLGGARLTFFCTGNVASMCPEIISRISFDGHEIGCHYYNHDLAYKDSPKIFEENLKRAIDALEVASNQRIRGFRAPKFSLRRQDFEHYKILERLFDYDSSLNFSSIPELEEFRVRSGIFDLAIFPVSSQKIIESLFPVKTGGTYLKLLPSWVTLRAMNKCKQSGFLPMVYLHPYEFVSDCSFYVPLCEMGGLSTYSKLYWLIRQSQWHWVGNKSVKQKLKRIFDSYEVGGRMSSLVQPIAAS